MSHFLLIKIGIFLTWDNLWKSLPTKSILALLSMTMNDNDQCSLKTFKIRLSCQLKRALVLFRICFVRYLKLIVVFLTQSILFVMRRWTFLSRMLRDCGENYIIFGSHIGEGDNKQQLHYTGLLCKMKREKWHDISVSRKFGCWCITDIQKG